MHRLESAVSQHWRWSAGLALSWVARRWRELIKGLLSPYRPELHYMRDPGPRCRDKHAAHAFDASLAVRICAPGTSSLRPGVCMRPVFPQRPAAPF